MKTISIAKALALPAAILLLASAHSQAAVIYQTATMGFGTNWNQNFWGTPAATPTSGNTYVNNDSGFLTRTSSTAFAGDSLTMQSNADLSLKSDASANLILDGGKMSLGDVSVAYTVSGSLEVASSSVIEFTNVGTINVAAPLSGSGGLSLTRTSGDPSGASLLNINGGGTYTGTITVNWNNLNTTIGFASSLSGATISAGTNAGKFNVQNTLTFAGFTWDGVTLAPGTYNYSQLTTAGIKASNLADLGGTITVIPEPTTWALLTASLTALVVFRRRRQV